jgi:hypothetical protein
MKIRSEKTRVIGREDARIQVLTVASMKFRVFLHHRPDDGGSTHL